MAQALLPAPMQVNYAIEYIAELLQLGELQVAFDLPFAVFILCFAVWSVQA